MAITPLPTPVPSSSDPANFDPRADEFLSALPGFATEANALADEVNGNAADVAQAASDVEDRAAEVTAAAMTAADAAGLVAQSTSTLVVGAGSKTIHFQSPKPALAVLNKRVVIVQLSDPSIRMFGTIATTDGSDDIAVTVVSSGAFGTGSYSAWQIIDAGFFGVAATKENIWAGTDDVAAATSKSLAEARKPVPIAFSAPLTLNFANGITFQVGPITSNFQLANPTISAEMVGLSGSVTLPQDGTGGRLISYGTYWKPSAAHQSLSSAASKSDTLYYEIKSTTRIEYNIVRDYLV